MRILVFATQHMPTGGIESHLREFCQHMAGAGAQIDLVITNSAMLPDTEAFYRRICRRLYLGRRRGAAGRLGWMLSVLTSLRANSYDVLYTNGQGESILYLSKLLPKRARWVHHHHTAGDEADQSHWGSRYWRALRTADNVIACSPTNATLMSKALHRPVDAIPCFSRAVAPIRPDAPATPNRVRLGYYGRLIPEKGIDFICQLSNDPHVADAEFHLWGEGEAYPAAFFEAYPGVVYHGSFSGREGLARALGTLDALLLLTTHGEGLPISLLEAMSAGLPWLATRRGGIPDIALDPMATRLLPTDFTYDLIKPAVRCLIDDLEAGRVDRQKQLNLYEQMFAAGTLTAQWYELFETGRIAHPQLAISA